MDQESTVDQGHIDGLSGLSVNPSCSASSFLSSLLLSVLSPDPSECVIDSGYSVIGKVMTCPRLKVVLSEMITNKRMKTSRRLSAAGFLFAEGRFFFEFSCAKFDTFLLWMGFMNLSSSVAHSSWNFSRSFRPATRLPVKYS